MRAHFPLTDNLPPEHRTITRLRGARRRVLTRTGDRRTHDADGGMVMPPG
ncbi:MAG: hypothetical protein GW911_09825 [Armatimonadetes bacterium]|nr:hypothetical protein [Armatimonadota bacterium]NCO92293.1 hypothetical protein [Armatimonadota bacterium]NCP32742.1 hypothetical protein [Armatimonadota bacterium]NCQ27850.1 hypothetical protein [Armatimonadota bacterium]NDK12335.1 hypothetical protein [Armatimonadota bacterium]